MARALRIEYAGAVYHVMSRGDRREAIFRDDKDRESFLELLTEASKKTGWEVHALCLMGNHFHLVIETPQPNLAVGMKWFLGIYTGRFNRRHRLVGHLFGGRYKALIVDAQTLGYLLTVCEYVHLNPVRAKLIKPEDPLKSYRWSSFPEYLKPAAKRWPWLRTDRLLGEMRLDPNKSSHRLRFETETEARRIQDQSPEEWKSIRRGWYFGGETLKERLLSNAEDDLVREHPRAPREESETARAERIVKEELKAIGWKEGHLKRTRKGDPGKVRIARRLRQETTKTLAWIASRLEMGSWTYVSNLLRQTGGLNRK